jgi:glycosyltransferase involved in cell wall biosynthesis
VTVITSPFNYLSGEPLDPKEAEMVDGHSGGEVRVIHARTYKALHKSFFHRTFFFLSFMVSSFTAGLRVREVDVVWGTTPPIFQAATAWAVARLKGVPFFLEVRDLWIQFAIAMGVLRNKLLIRLSLWLEKFLYRQADRLIVNSPGFVAHVLRRGGRHVEVIPNSADPDMFHPEDDGAAFRKAHGLQDAFVVMYAGAHGMSNDLGVVLEAARLLRERKPEVRIVLLGDGKEKPHLLQQAEELKLDNVLFLPPVPKSEMAGALAGADACVGILKAVEEYKTTYPNKVFDYMAAGRPVVLAIDGVIRKVVEAAEGGIFSPPGDAQALAQAIIRLADDPTQSRLMGLRGRKYLVEHFNREQMAAKLMGIFEGMKR